MTSVNPINGSNSTFKQFIINSAIPGGAIKGYMPPTTLLTDKRYNEYEQIRATLKNSWNTSYPSQLRQNNLTRPITTPFRAVMNAGDLLSRQNYSCGGTCQSVQSRPGLHGLKNHLGAVQSSCVPSVIYSSLQLLKNVPASSCTVKFVYDGSDYTTYLKQKAINKNYNALSYGGDQSHSTQSALRAIRRF